MEKLKILSQIYSGMLKVYFLTAVAWLKVRFRYGSFVIRKGSTDLHVFQQIFLYNDYEIKLDFAPEFIIDAGAYAGYSAIHFHLSYPAAAIACIEPSSSNFSVLDRNTSGIPKIRRYNAGMWSKPAFLKIEDRKTGNWGFRTLEVSEGEALDVRTVAVQDILQDIGSLTIDIFKIDIEGSEYELFSENLEWVGRVRVFIIEFHERIRPGCTQRFRDAIAPFSWKEFQQGENIIFIRQDFSV
jgi:FkbM family methyltransferase